MQGFLYGQSEYNLLKNAMRLNDYLNYGKTYGYPFLSLTDANLNAAYKFYSGCKKLGIKPVIGLEYTTLEGDVFLCYAKSERGYQSLLKIVSLTKAEEKSQDIKLLSENQKDLAIVLVISGSRSLQREATAQITFLNEYQKLFTDFYVGISLQDTKEINLNLQVMQLCMQENIICLPLHQILYLENEDYEVYNALCEIEGNGKQVNPIDDFAFPKNLNEFKEYPFLFKNLKIFIDKINLQIYQHSFPLPIFPNDKGVSSKDYLLALCRKGLEKRLSLNNITLTEEYYKRLYFELDVINRMKYEDYFLIVWEFVKYAKQSDILVGPGRGSAAGSLVAYVLGITEVDPIKFNLLFERFLNPERISMPDIDIDFPDDKRDEVIAHVRDFYGKKHVCNISAYGTFQIKSSVRDLARVLKWETERVNEVVSLAVNHTHEELLEIFQGREEYLKLFKIAKKLENLPRHISTHAAGIILSGAELETIIPLQSGLNDMVQSQFEASDLEQMGLLKMDFLGIRNLKMIDEMIQYIPGFTKRHLYDLSLTDMKTYQVLQTADTLGIFQLESTGIKKVLRTLKPVCFEDLVAVLALYRPGPMDNIDEYIQRNHGKPFSYIHPSLKSILAPTYGIIVYQEQIMQIVQVCGNYTLAEADLLRRAVSKKDQNALIVERTHFIQSSMNNGYSEITANEIYDYIVKFANYGFNRSHSVAYAMICYQMAYLKANHFTIFITNILNNVIASKSTLNEYIHYAKERGVKIFKPNINISEMKFIVTPNGVFMPLQAIFGIGEVVARQLINERKQGPFLSFDDFKIRCAQFVNNKIMEALIFSGALDIFAKTKKGMMEDRETYYSIIDKHLDGMIENETEYDDEVLAEEEEKYLGFNLEYSRFKNLIEIRANTRYPAIKDLQGNYNGGLIVKFSKLKKIKTKANDLMLVGTILDDTSRLKMVIFPSNYKLCETIINENNIFEIYGKYEINKKNNEPQFIIQLLKVVLKP